MPAAAVTPAPIAYIKVVAVKKLVVPLVGVRCLHSIVVGGLFHCWNQVRTKADTLEVPC